VRELLFSVTASDCKFDYMRGTGAGGQKRNKTESKVRCTHIASGAVAECDETRDQHKNKRIAFVKMANSDAFASWHKLEVARRLGLVVGVEERVDEMINTGPLKIEVKKDGKWVEDE